MKPLLFLSLLICLIACESSSSSQTLSVDEADNSNQIVPVFTLHDDDTMDKNISSSGTTWSGWSGGYATIFYPLVRSLGITACLSMEGQRVGFTDETPCLNENGRIVKHLQDHYGWEIMAHSMTARYVNNVYAVESVESELANEILAHATYAGPTSMSSTCIYDRTHQKNYVVNASKTGWDELPREYIRPYIMDYATNRVVAYNPTYPVDYQWKRFMELAQHFGFDVNSGVMPAGTGSHALCPLITPYLPNLFDVSSPLSFCNQPPLTTCVNRKTLESGSETSLDNTYHPEELEDLKRLVDETYQQKGWVVFYLHTYRPCWHNAIDSELQSHGGSYPDEWVHPITDDDDILSAIDTPPARLGITSWEQWYPCPGTRLRMVYDLINYAKERGLLNVNSKRGFKMFGNKYAQGFFAKGAQTGQDVFGIEGTRDNYPHRVIGADGTIDVF